MEMKEKSIKEFMLDLQDLLDSGVPEDIKIIAWDADQGAFEYVTGFLYNPATESIQICTDDMNTDLQESN
jgi:hypothetical protein